MHTPTLALSITMLAATLLAVQAVPVRASFDPDMAAFELQVDGKPINYRQFFLTTMPGSTLEIRAGQSTGSEHWARSSGGTLVPAGPGRWMWTAPDEPGRFELNVENGRDSIEVQLLVMRALTEVTDGYLNGYRIGKYPRKPLNNKPIYLPPKGLIEVHPDMIDLPLSPHFTLGQFLCKQQPDHWPKYLALREPLLIKLELILEEINRRGIATDSLFVMSGYRTPWYNRSLGNGQYSRHIWGGAADIFIDTNGDGRMDDLTGDGKVDVNDADLLRSIIEEKFGKPRNRPLRGGLGLYGPRPHRGPFVHVDVRGEDARWEFP